MDRVELDGVIYFRYGKKWADPNGIIVSEIMQDNLNRRYVETIDFDRLSAEELIKKGDQFKASGSLGLALRCYKTAFHNATQYEIGGILPRLTSLYRQMGKPEDAIAILTEASGKFGKQVISVPLLVSGAAAYCDMQDYTHAMECCKRAYKASGAKPSGELQAVYGRIKKENKDETD